MLTEIGGHRYQRVPPTEKNKSRIHTSTVTVAAFEFKKSDSINLSVIDMKDVSERVTKGTGPGGQNRNKRETAVILTHIPSGIEVKAEGERTQEGNRRIALESLKKKLELKMIKDSHKALNESRQYQVGGGARGDKRRTYRADGVSDHLSLKKAPLSKIQAGNLELLWD